MPLRVPVKVQSYRTGEGTCELDVKPGANVRFPKRLIGFRVWGFKCQLWVALRVPS